jgi:hypothetical protein
MTTDAYPGTHYFCVDVETSALRPWEEGATLLTIGVVVVDEKGFIVDDFYRRMNTPLHPSWYNEDTAPISETQAWWREQGNLAKQEAYADPFRDRIEPAVAASQFYRFVTQYGSDWTERIFVASPDKFDWIWTDWLLSQSRQPDPFWYHAIDLWSLGHGVIAQKRTGSKKGKLNLDKRVESHEARIPHHALSDAFAAAQDLCEYLDNQPIVEDEPYVEFTPAVATFRKDRVAVAEEVADEEVADEAEDLVLPADDAEQSEEAGTNEDE